MDRLKRALTDPDVVAQLTRGDVVEDIAELLRRWDEPGRPALLLVRDWDPPFARLYPEDELLETFPEVPLVHIGLNDEDGAPRLLVYVIDERGERAYAIPDPKARD